MAAFQQYPETGGKHLGWNYVELPASTTTATKSSLLSRSTISPHDGTHYFVRTLRDITKRQQARQQLQQCEQQLQILLEILPVGVCVADADGTLIEANVTFNQIWGEFADADSVADYNQYIGRWVETAESVTPEEWPLGRALHGEEVTDPNSSTQSRFDLQAQLI